MSARLTMRLDELRYDDDGYFSGEGQRALSTSNPTPDLEIERRVSAEGETTYRVYRTEAMSEARERSVRAGGGVMGLCSDHLQPGEARRLGASATVEDALLLLGLREVSS